MTQKTDRRSIWRVEVPSVERVHSQKLLELGRLHGQLGARGDLTARVVCHQNPL